MGLQFLKERLFFLVVVALCVAFSVWGVFSPESLGGLASELTGAAFGAMSWFFMLSVTAFLLICLVLAFSKYGKVRLGGPDDRPEFSTASWLGMLFAAGMGVGLLFWGVAEPIIHFTTPPVQAGGTAAAARAALVQTNFHWGLHAWAIYAIAGLVLAYFGFRKGTPNLPGAPIREAFRGAWVGPVATAADGIGVLAVALGVSGSMAMGILQIYSGLQVMTGLPGGSNAISAAILGVLVVGYMLSATTGLDKGIKWLSNTNMVIAILLLLFLLAAGPTATLLDGFVTSLGDYSSGLVAISMRLFPFRDLGEWTQSWTVTYFFWWLAWAPFVGVFIARISRGRTIREYVLGVLLAPTLFSVLWFGVFGGTAIFEEMWGLGGIAELVQEDVTVAVFSLFDRFPLSRVLGFTACLLVFIFLVTSADSATFVLGMLTSRGSLEPPASRKITWGILLGAMTAAMLFTGGIHTLRAVVVSGAVPFLFIMLLQIAALFRVLPRDAARREGGES
jgi:glycine betaine transporter